MKKLLSILRKNLSISYDWTDSLKFGIITRSYFQCDNFENSKRGTYIYNIGIALLGFTFSFGNIRLTSGVRVGTSTGFYILNPSNK